MAERADRDPAAAIVAIVPAAGRARSAPGAKFGRGPRIAGLTSVASTLLIDVHGVSRAFAPVRDDDEVGRRRLLNGCEQA
jgi:hypothetical protein